MDFVYKRDKNAISRKNQQSETDRGDGVELEI